MIFWVIFGRVFPGIFPSSRFVPRKFRGTGTPIVPSLPFCFCPLDCDQSARRKPAYLRTRVSAMSVRSFVRTPSSGSQTAFSVLIACPKRDGPGGPQSPADPLAYQSPQRSRNQAAESPLATSDPARERGGIANPDTPISAARCFPPPMARFPRFTVGVPEAMVADDQHQARRARMGLRIDATEMIMKQSDSHIDRRRYVKIRARHQHRAGAPPHWH